VDHIGSLRWWKFYHFPQITKDPFVVQKCVVLVLHPDLFLPDGRPIPINADRTLRAPGEPLATQSERSSWVSYYSQHHTPLLTDASECSFPEFEFKSLRRPEDSLSIFSLLVNANSKLQGVKMGFNNLLLMAYIHSVEIAVKSIFHVPEEVKDQPSSPVPPIPSVPSPHAPNATTPGAFDELARRLDALVNLNRARSATLHLKGQGSIDLDRQDDGVVEEENSDPDADDPGGWDFGEDEEVDSITGFPFAGMPGAKDIGYGFGEDRPDEIKGIRGMRGPLQQALRHEFRSQTSGGHNDDSRNGGK